MRRRGQGRAPAVSMRLPIRSRTCRRANFAASASRRAPRRRCVLSRDTVASAPPRARKGRSSSAQCRDLEVAQRQIGQSVEVGRGNEGLGPLLFQVTPSGRGPSVGSTACERPAREPPRHQPRSGGSAGGGAADAGTRPADSLPRRPGQPPPRNSKWTEAAAWELPAVAPNPTVIP